MSVGDKSAQHVHKPLTGAQEANAIQGTSQGMKVAGGTAALDGSNPTTIVTGLAVVTSFVAVLKGSSAPGDNTSVLTVNPNATAGSFDVYEWKNTGGSDPTLQASTGTESFYWLAIGY